MSIITPNKGDLVKFRWLQTADKLSSLAGMQMKFGANLIEITGRVAHIRGDHPTEPKILDVWLKIDSDLKMSTNINSTFCSKCKANEIGPIDYRHIVKEK